MKDFWPGDQRDQSRKIRSGRSPPSPAERHIRGKTAADDSICGIQFKQSSAHAGLSAQPKQQHRQIAVFPPSIEKDCHCSEREAQSLGSAAALASMAGSVVVAVH